MLSFKKDSFLGLDIGMSTIKVVELGLHNGKPCLENYAWLSVEKLGKKNDNINSDFFKFTLPAYIKKIVKESGIKTKKTFLAIPAFSGLITLIDFPDVPDSDMEQAIKFEAHKYIPTSLNEVGLSWEVVEDSFVNPLNGVKKKKKKVLLVVASKNKIIAYENIVNQVGLKAEGIEIESIPMTHSLVGNDKGNFFVLDIGYKTCNIIYVQKGIIVANRNINAGGKDITNTIAKALGVTYEKAEMIKVSGKNFFSLESSIQFPSLEIISQEIARILESFSRNGNQPNVDALILSGGTAKLVGLTGFFQDKFKIKTIVGNPFSRIRYNEKLEPFINNIKSQFSVSVGLALIALKNYNS